ncbi:MAG TPA: sulfatase [Opitutaceae bacterium]|nr:sulfatase [Opitutaceae bacterium]
MPIPSRPPNVILINCDDLGYGDLGCYRSDRNLTPHVDRLAAEGRRFTDFYMASPVCSPSRGAMLTGCYPPRIGFGSFDGRWVLFPGQAIGLNPAEVTIARVLQGTGYATALFGKWHCGDQAPFLPTCHGFDEYFGLPYSNDMGRQQGADPSYPPLPLLCGDEVVEEQPDQTSLTERYVERAVQFMRRNRDRPFFLYFAHLHVHLPHYVPERFLRESGNGRYGAAVACIDWATGVLMSELRRMALEENTLVLFTSDNGSRAGEGGGSNGPLRGTKGTTWEGGQRVPCIARWPARIPAGTVCRELTTAMDFLPTLAGLAGATLPGDRIIDGRDVRDLWLGIPGATSPHQAFYYYLKDDLEAVRSGPWKLHLRRDGQELAELYELTEDPGERHNRFRDHPEVVARLRSLAEGARAELGDAATAVRGRHVRPAGRVDRAAPLTQYDPNHPYLVAMYDLEERG